ncbi:MAG: polymorphic toxin-type HINT domain-containing protein [Mediterraneibacter sp.]
MATIALYAGKMNQMSSLLKDAKKSVSDYQSELFSLKSRTLNINRSVCDLDDVISSVQASTQLQEQKMDSLETLSRNVENFIADVVRIDDDAAEAINQSKEEFYDKYNYLKPDCEKNIWEKICDGFASVGEWCKEHWKLVVTAVLVIVAVVIIVLSGGTAVAPFLLMIAKGTIAGAVSGGLIGGLSSLLNGGSFMDGFEEGAFSGAIGGAIFGGIGGAGQALGKGISCLSKLGEFVKDLSIISGAASTGMAAFDLLAMADLLIGGDNNWLYDLNQRLHSSTLYNSFQIGVSVLAAFTGGMRQTMTCFVAGTMILTASGLIAIENIKAGDKVISTNPETFETAEKSVLETYVRQTDKLIHLVINGEEIITTETHPFYVKDRGFVDAGKLLVGDSLLDVYGNILVVEDTRTEHLDEPETVYNFQVEDFHTYYVGERFIWVHNGECGGSYRSLKRDKNGKMYDSEEIHHMPAKKSSLLSEGDGPAIRMEKRDHERTASWGRAKKSQVYRLKQENLIKAGKFREAIQMDVDDLKVQFGNKYDKGIREMWEYVNELERDGKI